MSDQNEDQEAIDEIAASKITEQLFSTLTAKEEYDASSLQRCKEEKGKGKENDESAVDDTQTIIDFNGFDVKIEDITADLFFPLDLPNFISCESENSTLEKSEKIVLDIKWRRELLAKVIRAYKNELNAEKIGKKSLVPWSDDCNDEKSGQRIPRKHLRWAQCGSAILEEEIGKDKSEGWQKREYKGDGYPWKNEFLLLEPPPPTTLEGRVALLENALKRKFGENWTHQ